MPNLENIPKINVKFLQAKADKKADPFYTSRRWRRVRDMAKQRDAMMCQRCKANGTIKIIGNKPRDYAVDHIKPRKLWEELELTLDNLQTLCRRCHDTKTREEMNIYTREDWRNKYE